MRCWRNNPIDEVLILIQHYLLPGRGIHPEQLAVSRYTNHKIRFLKSRTNMMEQQLFLGFRNSFRMLLPIIARITALQKLANWSTSSFQDTNRRQSTTAKSTVTEAYHCAILSLLHSISSCRLNKEAYDHESGCVPHNKSSQMNQTAGQITGQDTPTMEDAPTTPHTKNLPQWFWSLLLLRLCLEGTRSKYQPVFMGRATFITLQMFQRTWALRFAFF